MTVFILPTAGKRGYRGKYPTRAYSVSATRNGGRHVELNNGVRLWSIDDRTPEFNAAGPYDDYAAILARAVRMTAEQYAELQRAAELDRSIIKIAGNTRRESVREQARQIRLAITQPTVPPAPATGATGTIRLNLRRQAASMAEIANNENAATVAVRTIDCTPTWAAIVPILRAGIENGTPEGKRLAWLEIERMAALADDRNTLADRLARIESVLDDASISADALAVESVETKASDPFTSLAQEIDTALAIAKGESA